MSGLEFVIESDSGWAQVEFGDNSPLLNLSVRKWVSPVVKRETCLPWEARWMLDCLRTAVATFLSRKEGTCTR